MQIQSEHVSGQFVDIKGERFYKISHVDQMSPFFISIVSASNHWLFISSTGGLSAGRVRPENALFPYRSVDYIHENAETTGSKAVLKVRSVDGRVVKWEPFNPQHDGMYDVQRNLYKNTIGDKILFEEENQTLGLTYRYSWSTSDRFGFIRETELLNTSATGISGEILDGMQNLQPSGAPLSIMQFNSALVDAYKWNERIGELPLVTYSLYAKLSDKADPAEALRTTTVFSVNKPEARVLLHAKAIQEFRKGVEIQDRRLVRGERGAYFVFQDFDLAPGQTERWVMAADIDLSHNDLAKLKHFIAEEKSQCAVIRADVKKNHDELISLMSGADAWQCSSSEETDVHHYANVLFNSMRGGTFIDGYTLDPDDVRLTFARTNKSVAGKHAAVLADFPKGLTNRELITIAEKTGDAQLVRLAYEYLPLTFGRRHGDPSRPWNHYEIKLRDEEGNRLLAYQGNWRDIFQNWEALTLSYPYYAGSFIAKFVNASTADGYNPYRITKDGFDWEEIEPGNPWSNIGYWGDHQIIYLVKLLELADKYQSDDLVKWLSEAHYAYANVPYEIKGIEELLADSKNTVKFDDVKNEKVRRLSQEMGSDGRLILNADGSVYQVNLLEKLMVPLLAKMSNFVVDGGIWLNTQRPEWNDANNAIVGNGLSMVTLYYMRRYVAFVQKLLGRVENEFEISREVRDWLVGTSSILVRAVQESTDRVSTPAFRKNLLLQLGKAGEIYRNTVYANGFSCKSEVTLAELQSFLSVTQELLDRSIRNNKRPDGLYNAYNILNLQSDGIHVDELYPMLEGQVSLLSSGALNTQETIDVLDALFASEMYREDQKSFMLYPDRQLKGFADKNQIVDRRASQSKLIAEMMTRGDNRIVTQDVDGVLHFNADFDNALMLAQEIDSVRADYPAFGDEAWTELFSIHEATFHHKAFTGRSGTMFGYEGLGCIYWHMVSKLLVAVQENYFHATLTGEPIEQLEKLESFYFRVREGLSFNKTPLVYGAFPTDPYSHTSKQSGAQQPGMTGQVKEELITRFGELGIFVKGGRLEINPILLKRSDFLKEPAEFVYQDINHDEQRISLDKDSLAFTYCQVPFIYKLDPNVHNIDILVETDDGVLAPCNTAVIQTLNSEILFSRSGTITAVYVSLPKEAFS